MKVIDDHDVTVWQGDALEQLALLPAESVQCIVTSPPYYGLRDYGTGTWDDGDPNCDHRTPAPGGTRNKGRDRAASGGVFHDSPKVEPDLGVPYRGVCGKCGASRVDRQIGLEPSPAAYVETLRAVFNEARRVLAKDGVMWLNLGDSYYSGRGNPGPNSADEKQEARRGWVRPVDRCGQDWAKPKDLLGIPWRTAFALQDDGWTLRNDVIWAKPNAMPESVTDRLSTRHEHVFLFSRSRRYWFGLDAIREPLAYPDAADGTRVFGGSNKAAELTTGSSARRTGNVYVAATTGRNPGDVWTIPTAPTPYAHFATMPPELVRRCILAGCPEGGTVLDPFAGSGTTLMVARKLARKAVGIELNPDYVDIIRRRIGQEPLLFGEETA